MAGEAAEALAGRSMSAAEGRLKSRLDTLSDGDRRAVEDAVATHPDPPNRGGPIPPFPFPSRSLPAILRTPASARADLFQPDGARMRLFHVFMGLALSACLAFAAPAFSADSPEPVRVNSIGMEFVLIPAGSFLMGDPKAEGYFAEVKRPHRVNITRPFYLGKYEVTQEQWERVMGSNPSRFKGRDNPVESVSWNDAQEFVRRLNAMEGHRRYRLPTEAEWEYAARAGSTTAYSFGDDAGELGDYGWYEANSGKGTHPVGQLRPNAWGLYDMHGNVWEWVNDWYDAKYYAYSRKTDNPGGPNFGESRAGRGGSLGDWAVFCRSSERGGSRPDHRTKNGGFRLALTPEWLVIVPEMDESGGLGTCGHVLPEPALKDWEKHYALLMNFIRYKFGGLYTTDNLREYVQKEICDLNRKECRFRPVTFADPETFTDKGCDMRGYCGTSDRRKRFRDKKDEIVHAARLGIRTDYITSDIWCMYQKIYKGHVYEYWVFKASNPGFEYEDKIYGFEYCKFFVTKARSRDGERIVLYQSDQFFDKLKIDERFTLVFPKREYEITIVTHGFSRCRRCPE